MKLSGMTIKLTGIIDESTKIVVLSVAPYNAYDSEGHDTGVLKGYRYQLCELESYEKFFCKVEGTVATITNDQIQTAKGKIPVTLQDCVGRVYRNNSGEYDISFSAKAISVARTATAQ